MGLKNVKQYLSFAHNMRKQIVWNINKSNLKKIFYRAYFCQIMREQINQFQLNNLPQILHQQVPRNHDSSIDCQRILIQQQFKFNFSDYVLQKFRIKLNYTYHQYQMQAKYFLSVSKSNKALSKETSKLSIANTSCSSVSSTTSNQTEKIDDEYRRLAVKWIFSYSKKLSKDTQFLAVSYINQLRNKSIFINEKNYEQIAVSTLLIAFKINEISSPKISSMLAKCKKALTKQEILQMEFTILLAFDFNMVCQRTTYSDIKTLLGDRNSLKIEESEKLLRAICTNQQIYRFGGKILAFSIILLVFPEFNLNLQFQEIMDIKTLAKQLFRLYSEAKERHDQEKKRSLK